MCMEAKSYYILMFSISHVELTVSLAYGYANSMLYYQVSNLPALDYRHGEIGDQSGHLQSINIFHVYHF